MHSFSPDFLDGLSFTPEEVRLLTALAEARGRQDLHLQKQPGILESLRQTAVVESTQSSSRLEGVRAPRKRIEGIVLRSTNPRNRPEQEISGYRDALALVHESHADLPFSAQVLLRLHGLLFRQVPGGGGRYKEEDNEIVERGPGGEVLRVRFRPTPAAITPAAMIALQDRYRAAIAGRGLPSLVAAPLAVLDLLCIHPFADGNGRVARLATLLLLYHQGFAVGRYISVERIVEEARGFYYEALLRSSAGWHEGAHDPHPWLRFWWETVLRACTEFEQRVGKVASGSGGKRELVRAAILRHDGPFTSADIGRACPGVSHDLVRLVVRSLRDEGAIALRGRGRGARWVRTGG